MIILKFEQLKLFKIGSVYSVYIIIGLVHYPIHTFLQNFNSLSIIFLWQLFFSFQSTIYFCSTQTNKSDTEEVRFSISSDVIISIFEKSNRRSFFFPRTLNCLTKKKDELSFVPCGKLSCDNFRN